ncbi:MAG: GNAT family N-acetyltransferase [Proteobacteria bacterium]|nr:GNAT family N-acetyltransferase [Pseudomonadota bacterium]
MSHDLQIELTAAPAPAELAAEWTALEARAQHSFFVSWTWIGAWLAALPGELRPRLLRARRGRRVVGLALFVPGRDRTLPLIGGRGLWLHATGRPELDAIAIEHNGPLVDANEPDVAPAMLDYLCRRMGPWRRVTLPHLRPTEASTPATAASQAGTRQHDEASWVVDLQAVRASTSGYTGLLQAKTRYAIRRTRMACEALGPIRLTVAEGRAAVQEAMPRLLRLHARRWQQREGGSSFLLPFTQRFHERLLPSASERGEVQLLSVTVGPHELGHLYSFVHRGRVSFYQSGVDYELLGPKMSPGLLMLALAIEHNAALGHQAFDLLGGAGHYKKDLATHQETLSTVVLEQRDWRLALETHLRARVLPWLRRAGGDTRDWRIGLRNWLGRIGLGLSLGVLALAVDACSDEDDAAIVARSAAQTMQASR